MFLDYMKQWFSFYKEYNMVDKKYICVYKQVKECILWVSIVFITILCTPQPCIGQIHMLSLLKCKSNGKDILLWLHSMYEAWLGIKPSHVKNEKSSTHHNLLQLINMITKQRDIIWMPNLRAFWLLSCLWWW
jgi:hypothetical protein